MRIYRTKDKKSILSLNLNKQTVSTRTEVFKTFVQDLLNGVYEYFTYEEAGVIYADEYQVKFYGYEGVGNENVKIEEEVYDYLGEVNNEEELMSLLGHPQP